MLHDTTTVVVDRILNTTQYFLDKTVTTTDSQIDRLQNWNYYKWSDYRQGRSPYSLLARQPITASLPGRI